jgi:hypothetical protein
MRLLSFLLLLALAGAAAVLAYENREQEVSLTLFGRPVAANIPALVGLTYLAGMLSGWTVVGMFRWSLSGPTDAERTETRR